MTMNVTGRKASLYATAMAISLVAISGAASAQSVLNGRFATAVVAEAKGAIKTPPVVTLDVAAAAFAEANKKVEVSTALLAARSSGPTGTATTYDELKSALSNEKTAVGLAATEATKLADALAEKTKADALVAKLASDKTAAAAAVATAAAAKQAQIDAKAALPVTASATEIAAADAAIARANAALALVTTAQTPVDTAYNAAVLAAGTALSGYTAAITSKGAADADVLNKQATRLTKSAAFDTAIAADTGFAKALAAYNAAAGTNFTASYAGIAAIDAYDDPVVSKYASNGTTRLKTALAAAEASSNTNISLASGALTGSEAALEVGAAFETEVLSALVDHEGRIVANTTAISALDVRTTANAAAITKETADRIAADTLEANARIAEDKRIVGLVSAETTARLAQNAELRDRISSSTATAIALGGAALLPDMGFTLSGNVSFYEGAQAMALNAAAKVGPNAYVTAAVGGGLNKHGSVGGRVGFVFGF